MVFEHGQFKHAQREGNPKLVLMLGSTLGGVVWNPSIAFVVYGLFIHESLG